MIAADPPGTRPTGQALLWTGAAVLAAAAHAGALLWALRQPQPTAFEPDPAPAVLIDLTPAQVAPQAPVENLAPDAMDAPEIETSLPEIALTPPPIDFAPPLPASPEPPLSDAPVDPLDSPLADALPAVEPPPEFTNPEPRPVARPRELRVARAPEPEKPEPKKPEPAQPSRAAARAQTVAPAAKVAAAPQNATGASAAVSPAKWQARLMAHLERRKRYPAGARQRREEGVVTVRFAIDGGGNVRSATLVRSSGHAELDDAVLALVRRASPVPAPPPGAPHEITAPVRFSIR